MIDYDPHHWSSHLFDIRGSMVREICGRLVLLTVWSAFAVYLCAWFALPGTPDFTLYLSPVIHQIVGAALSLLLVFRTNSSYDRFWEGRKLWGGMVNETRNLARGAVTHLRETPPLRDELLLWTIAFPYAAMYSLRKKARTKKGPKPLPAETTQLSVMLGPVAKALSAEDERAMLTANHLPTAVAVKLTSLLRAARDQGHITDIVFTALDQHVQLFIDYLGGCERIHSTPIPYAYMVHARRVLILYCATLPFALAENFGYKSVPLTFLVGYVFFGLEEIGVEIEDPFGEDENDLPLERFCGTIERNLTALLSTAAPPKPE